MNAHPHTPTLSVMDPRALAIREVGYCRHPDENVIASRITRQVFDAAGRLVESWDPRLWASASKPNLATIHGLSGHPLLTDSVDAGWQLSLLNQAGSLRSFWDARGSQRHIDFDDQQRPIAVTEQPAEALPRVVERLTYGGSAPAFAVHNQCAKLIRHDNPASTRFVPDFGLAGSQLSENQCFLIDLEPPDWPSEFEARDALLEDQSFVTRHVFSPTGEIQRQTDAMGNDRTFAYDVAGRLSETWLLMAGEGRPPQQLVSDIRYNAHDQIESEIAGNGVKTQAEYDAENGRLIRLVATVGSQKLLQDLHYVYDAAGNIIKLEDKAQAVTWFNNQRIEPINRYRYDSLSQLVEASGWEVANPSHGPALPDLLPTPLDPNQRRNYTQRFEYDAAGNLITRQHSGAPGFSMFTSARSNRSLAQRDDGSLPGESEIESGFDACGNQLELQRGQTMTWDIRNQLSRVTLVKRGDEPDDYEGYVYDRPGHRLRKVHFNRTSGRTGRSEVRYLPNLEIHRQADGEERHVISIEAGRCSVRSLHWPEGTHADQLRYSLCDHLGSSTLELDHEAGVLTQEHYYAFGGTACWAGKNALVAKYKTFRYSGKERDVTGLYYYGFRYYAPWLQRWMCPDPAGDKDGLNRYAMVRNNPINFYDWQGTISIPVDIFIADIVNSSSKTIYSGWFEELMWDQEKNTFMSTGPVYTRGMEVIQGADSEWYPSSFGHAIAAFRDQDGKLRLFANMHYQHMGIQPGMGLPEFAGLLKVDKQDPSKLVINNHSGHYKPESSIDVEAMIREIAPQQQSVSYAPIPESSSFDSTLRINSIDSPETYERLVNMYKRDFNGLITYLKEQGVWEAAKANFGESEGLNIIFKMEAKGMTAQQIYNEESMLGLAKPLAEPVQPSIGTSRVTRPLVQNKTKKTSFFRSLGHRLGQLYAK
ncbi:RHS repeat protein [Pseudomonas sp. MM213]|uniref:RHS repeat domain-containing protein n=1 Tax=Pseudomonas sp. MM213 TaxID=2866807 RepID=UPI001CF35309|nr:RHS repeat-associated core domain-containing protein [Pseudomonas sp. MM213]UCP08500.1 RHS repeat protein [Pseudomonas sp. MM213]